MEGKKSFVLLGIEQTKDEGKIREAYLKKLPEFNPEDDPEGFRRLRAAYARALEELLSGAFCREWNVLYQSAEFSREAGERERSVLLYETLKADCPRHYMANLRLSEAYLDRDEPERAKRCVNTLLSYPMSETAERWLTG